MRNNKSCSNCIKGTEISVNGDILCRENGAVSPDYVCSRHKYMPIQIKSSQTIQNKCIDCELFIMEVKSMDGTTAMGLCQLFSVRQFDGKQKKACSKFVKKSELEVG